MVITKLYFTTLGSLRSYALAWCEMVRALGFELHDKYARYYFKTQLDYEAIDYHYYHHRHHYHLH